MADIVITKPSANNIKLRKEAVNAVSIERSSSGGGGGVKLTPTAELDGSAVLFHYVTLEQMEKMHINTNAGIVGFDVTEDDEDFHLRFSQDSPQELAGEIVYEDSLAIKDDVFETIRVPLVGYEITYVRMDGVDANLLEADINWRLADLQKRIGEGSSGDAAEQVKDFFGIVKDGDTVKVVTEDGVEEVVEPVGLMDEDDVYDYLEDIAVLMGGITAQQAAAITAATRAIIHGGSGSGEGGEGGSGSGSGE